jgi:hypothetical protein
VGNQVEDTPSQILVIRQSPRALDCLVGVRDGSATPAPHLVPEDPKASRPAASDRTFGDDATLGAVVVGRRRLLDHIARLRYANLERRVVEVARRASLDPSCDRLEDSPVQPNRVAAGAEREPVEVDPSLRLCRHAGILTTDSHARIGAETDRDCG